MDDGYKLQLYTDSALYPLCHINLLSPPQDLAPCYLFNYLSDFESLDRSTGTPSIGDGHIESEINSDPPVINIYFQTHDTNIYGEGYVVRLILSAAAINCIFKPPTDLLLLTGSDFTLR